MEEATRGDEVNKIKGAQVHWLVMDTLQRVVPSFNVSVVVLNGETLIRIAGRGSVRVHVDAQEDVWLSALDAQYRGMVIAHVTRENVSWAVARVITSALLDVITHEVEQLPLYAAVQEGT
jgi:hypothetical protein